MYSVLGLFGHAVQIGEEIHLTKVKVSTAIKTLKAGKALGEDNIQLKMLWAMNNFGVCWLTRVFQESLKLVRYYSNGRPMC